MVPIILIMAVCFVGYIYIIFPAKWLGPYFGYLVDLRVFAVLFCLIVSSFIYRIFNWVRDGYRKDGGGTNWLWRIFGGK